MITKNELRPDTVTASTAGRRHTSSSLSFSRAARYFEQDERQNTLARWTRRRSLAALDAAFSPGDMVLELGCGTGIEAIHLARRGVRIVATDAAPGMIEMLSSKLSAGGSAEDLSGFITPVLLRAGAIGELVRTYGAGAFDGCYSSMGPLNCEPELEPVAHALSLLVKPGGKLVFSILNRVCLWETAWYLRARQPNLAFRRWRGRAIATSRPEWPDEVFTCYYWPRSEIEGAFGPYFRVTSRKGLPWLLPPLYLHGLVGRAPRLFRLLARLDRRFAHVRPAYSLGDHLLIEMVKKAGPRVRDAQR